MPACPPKAGLPAKDRDGDSGGDGGGGTSFFLFYALVLGKCNCAGLSKTLKMTTETGRWLLGHYQIMNDFKQSKGILSEKMGVSGELTGSNRLTITVLGFNMPPGGGFRGTGSHGINLLWSSS